MCYDQGRACRSYRVRFLCGRPGKQATPNVQGQRGLGALGRWLLVVHLDGWVRGLRVSQ